MAQVLPAGRVPVIPLESLCNIPAEAFAPFRLLLREGGFPVPAAAVVCLTVLQDVVHSKQAGVLRRT